MGKSNKDHNKRAHKLELKQEKHLARLLAARDDDDLSDDSAFADSSTRPSRKGSRVASRAASRAASPFPADRVGSDLEDSSFLSPLRRPVGSARSSRHASRIQTPEESDLELDQRLSLDSLDGDELLRRMSQILSSKTSTRGAGHKMKKASGRSSKRNRQEVNNTSAASQKEEALSRLCEFLREDVFLANVADGQVHDMHSSILVSIKQPGSPNERNLALQAFAMVAITSGADESFLSSVGLLKEIIGSDASENTKALAIHALTAVICFGDSGQEHRDRLLDYLLDIVQTDGDSTNARDSALVVGAAMEAWAFVATGCELHEHSVSAMEAFIEQLESSNSNVQVLAASNIALMFDIARQLRTAAEDEAGPGQEPDVTKMLDLYDDPKRLAQRIRSLSKEQSAARSRQNRATRKEQLEYAAVSLEMDVGYGYNTQTRVGNREVQWYLGYSEALKVNERKILIKSWAVWSKVRFLQSVLGGGFANHFDENEKVEYFLSEAPTLGLLEDWDHEAQQSHAATDIRQFWDDGHPGEAADENEV